MAGLRDDIRYDSTFNQAQYLGGVTQNAPSLLASVQDALNRGELAAAREAELTGQPNAAARMGLAQQLADSVQLQGPRSIFDVQDAGGAMSYLGNTLGGTLPDMTAAIMGGSAATALSPIRAAVAGLSLPAVMGAAVPSYDSLKGESLLTQMADPTLSARTPEEQMALARSTALKQSIPESLFPALAGKTGLLGGALVEGATEGAQDAIAQTDMMRVDPNRQYDARQTVENVAAGALIGGALGGVGGTHSTPTVPAQDALADLEATVRPTLDSLDQRLQQLRQRTTAGAQGVSSPVGGIPIVGAVADRISQNAAFPDSAANATVNMGRRAVEGVKTAVTNVDDAIRTAKTPGDFMRLALTGVDPVERARRIITDTDGVAPLHRSDAGMADYLAKRDRSHAEGLAGDLQGMARDTNLDEATRAAATAWSARNLNDPDTLQQAAEFVYRSSEPLRVAKATAELKQPWLDVQASAGKSYNLQNIKIPPAVSAKLDDVLLRHIGQNDWSAVVNRGEAEPTKQALLSFLAHTAGSGNTLDKNTVRAIAKLDALSGEDAEGASLVDDLIGAMGNLSPEDARAMAAARTEAQNYNLAMNDLTGNKNNPNNTFMVSLIPDSQYDVRDIPTPRVIAKAVDSFWVTDDPNERRGITSLLEGIYGSKNAADTVLARYEPKPEDGVDGEAVMEDGAEAATLLEEVRGQTRAGEDETGSDAMQAYGDDLALDKSKRDADSLTQHGILGKPATSAQDQTKFAYMLEGVDDDHIATQLEAAKGAIRNTVESDEEAAAKPQPEMVSLADVKLREQGGNVQAALPMVTAHLKKRSVEVLDAIRAASNDDLATLRADATDKGKKRLKTVQDNLKSGKSTPEQYDKTAQLTRLNAEFKDLMNTLAAYDADPVAGEKGVKDLAARYKYVKFVDDRDYMRDDVIDTMKAKPRGKEESERDYKRRLLKVSFKAADGTVKQHMLGIPQMARAYKLNVGVDVQSARERYELAFADAVSALMNNDRVTAIEFPDADKINFGHHKNPIDSALFTRRKSVRGEDGKWSVVSFAKVDEHQKMLGRRRMTRAENVAKAQTKVANAKTPASRANLQTWTDKLAKAPIVAVKPKLAAEATTPAQRKLRTEYKVLKAKVRKYRSDRNDPDINHQRRSVAKRRFDDAVATLQAHPLYKPDVAEFDNLEKALDAIKPTTIQDLADIMDQFQPQKVYETDPNDLQGYVLRNKHDRINTITTLQMRQTSEGGDGTYESKEDKGLRDASVYEGLKGMWANRLDTIEDLPGAEAWGDMIREQIDFLDSAYISAISRTDNARIDEFGQLRGSVTAPRGQHRSAYDIPATAGLDPLRTVNISVDYTAPPLASVIKRKSEADAVAEGKAIDKALARRVKEAGETLRKAPITITEDAAAYKQFVDSAYELLGKSLHTAMDDTTRNLDAAEQLEIDEMFVAHDDLELALQQLDSALKGPAVTDFDSIAGINKATRIIYVVEGVSRAMHRVAKLLGETEVQTAPFKETRAASRVIAEATLLGITVDAQKKTRVDHVADDAENRMIARQKIEDAVYAVMVAAAEGKEKPAKETIAEFGLSTVHIAQFRKSLHELRLVTRRRANHKPTDLKDAKDNGIGHFLHGTELTNYVASGTLPARWVKMRDSLNKRNDLPPLPKPGQAAPNGGEVNIWYGSGENADLSNLAVRPFSIDGNTFKTVEGAFQARKMDFSSYYWTPDTMGESKALLAQFQNADGATAKRLGKSVKNLNSSEWDSKSPGVMKETLLKSFEQNPTALAALTATGNALLTHKQDKGKWGTLFPKLLMEVRKELGGSKPVLTPKTAKFNKTIFDKDAAKWAKATKYIGFGAPGSSTAHYAVTLGETLANTGEYTKDDVVYVSMNGNDQKITSEMRAGNQEKTKAELRRAMDAGATIVIDSKEYREKKGAYTRDKKIADFLMAQKQYREEGGTGVFKSISEELGITEDTLDEIFNRYNDPKDGWVASIEQAEQAEADLNKLSIIRVGIPTSDTMVLDGIDSLTAVLKRAVDASKYSRDAKPPAAKPAAEPEVVVVPEVVTPETMAAEEDPAPPLQLARELTPAENEVLEDSLTSATNAMQGFQKKIKSLKSLNDGLYVDTHAQLTAIIAAAEMYPDSATVQKATQRLDGMRENLIRTARAQVIKVERKLKTAKKKGEGITPETDKALKDIEGINYEESTSTKDLNEAHNKLNALAAQYKPETPIGKRLAAVRERIVSALARLTTDVEVGKLKLKEHRPSVATTTKAMNEAGDTVVVAPTPEAVEEAKRIIAQTELDAAALMVEKVAAQKERNKAKYDARLVEIAKITNPTERLAAKQKLDSHYSQVLRKTSGYGTKAANAMSKAQRKLPTPVPEVEAVVENPSVATPEQVTEAANAVKRMRGDQARVVFSEMLGSRSSHRADEATGERIIDIAIASLSPLSQAYHESMHDLLHVLKGSPDTQVLYHDLRRAASSARTMNRLRELLKDEPEALAQIENDKNERVAYMFQFYAEGVLNLRRDQGIITKIINAIRAVLGVIPLDERAILAMDALQRGDMSTPSAIHNAMKNLRLDGSKTALASFTAPLRLVADRVFAISIDQLHNMDNEALSEIADMFAITPEREGIKGPAGFMRDRQQQHGIFMNRLSRILADTTAEQRVAIIRNMQSMNSPATPAEHALRAWLDDMYTYLHDAGVQSFNYKTMQFENIRQVKSYAPRVWTITDDNQAKYRQTLIKYGVEPSEADRLIVAIRSGDGMVDLAEGKHDIGFTPVMAAAASRKFTFITAENAAEFAEFQSDDLMHVMSTYAVQATHRGEYSRWFGSHGEVLQRKLAEAKEQGATDEQIDRTITIIKGLEGTLGSTINPYIRTAQNGLITLQNLILLPLALLSSLLDPMGIAIRTGRMDIAWDAFRNGLKDMLIDANIIGPNQDDAARHNFAEFLGIVDNQNVMDAMGYTHSSMFMGPMLRKINDKFFRWNGMNAWNRSMRSTASVAAVQYIREHRNDVNRMRELGITTEQAAQLHDDAESISPEVSKAIYTFVDTAILRPNAALRPTWMSDPRFLLISHLKQFTFSFQNVIMRRVGAMADRGEYLPAAMLAFYVPLQITVDLLRGLINGTGWHDTSLSMSMIGRAIENSGVTGVASFGIDASADSKYGGVFGSSFLGPTFEHGAKLLEGMMGDATSTEVLLRSVPGGTAVRGWV